MATAFLLKRLKGFVVALSCAVLVGVTCYGVGLSLCESVDTGCGVYFVSVSEGGVEACVQEVLLDGGAGYLYGDSVVASVCFEEEAAESVRESISKKYPSAKVKTLTDGEVCTFRSKKGESVEMVRRLYAHMRMLSSVADGLDDGVTQEGARRMLLAAKVSFDTLSKTYPKQKKLQTACQEAKNFIEEREEGVLYSRDIRTCVCHLAEAFLDFSHSLGI